MSVFFTRRGKTPSLGKRASDYAVGESVFLMENGTAVEYLVVNQGIPSGSSLYDSSCDGVWVLRKDIYEKRVWDSSNTPDYEDSTIHTYLNGTFLGLFGADIQEKIKTVKIPYYVNAQYSGSNGLSTKVFLLSGYEVGFTTVDNYYFPVDGAKLDYFESGDTYGGTNRTKRIGYLDGTATDWWLRSRRYDASSYVWAVLSTGSYGDPSASGSYGIRPALILDSETLFDSDTNIIK